MSPAPNRPAVRCSDPTPRVTLDINDEVAVVHLARGEAGNAIDQAWSVQFAGAIDAIERSVGAGTARQRVRAVLLSAAGRAFCVGADIGVFHAAGPRFGELLYELVRDFNIALLRLAELPVPVVAAVQGAAAGGALGMLWASDVVLCAPEAKFASAFHRLGFSGDGGSSWYLPRLVGPRRAAEMMLQGRVLTAAEAFDWGLVTEVTPADELAARARDEAQNLARGPSLALGHIRSLLRGHADVSLREHLVTEAEHMRACGASDDAFQGIAAFTERREPVFRGC